MHVLIKFLIFNFTSFKLKTLELGHNFAKMWYDEVNDYNHNKPIFSSGKNYSLKTLKI